MGLSAETLELLTSRLNRLRHDLAVARVCRERAVRCLVECGENYALTVAEVKEAVQREDAVSRDLSEAEHQFLALTGAS